MRKANPVFHRSVRQAIQALVFVSLASAADAADRPPQSPVFVYECDNLATIAGRQFADRLEVWGTGFAPLVLPQVGAEPATYATETVRMTMTGEYLRMTGRMGSAICRSKPGEAPWQDAKRRGIEFRATGDHPDDWVLEYDEGIALTFVAGRGRQPLIAIPRRVVANDSERMTIEASDGARDVLVTVDRAVCTGPSGVTTTRVAVTIAHHTFSGCGRMLLSGTLRGTISWPGRLADGGAVSVRIVRVAAPTKSPAVLAVSTVPIRSNGESPFELDYDPLLTFGNDRFAIEASMTAGSHTHCTRGRVFVLTWGRVGGVTLSPDMFTRRTRSSHGC